MLRSIRKIDGHRVVAVDGEVGRVHDALLDDREWTVRLLVIDTGGWLRGRKVVLSPVAFTGVDWATGNIELRVSRDDVERSPEVDTAMPVTHEHARAQHDHYGWPFYWGGTEIFDDGVTPQELSIAARYPGVLREAAEQQAAEPDKEDASPERGTASHLHAVRDLGEFHLEAIDGTLGKILDVLVDDADWRVRYFAVGSGDWRDGRKVLIPANEIARLNARQRKLYTDMTAEEVRRGPVWDPERPLDGDFEQHVRMHTARSPHDTEPDPRPEQR